jgi:UDP-glucose:(heptosyl)LPS alpha-1,3-glucosyltransferase
MRIALVHETASPSLGGAERSTLEMAAALVRAGHDVTLVTREPQSEAQDSRLESGVLVHSIPVESKTRAGRAIGFVSAADEFCLGQGFEIIHAVTPCLSANVYQPRGGTYPETIRRNLALEPTWIHRAIKWIDRRLNWRQRFLTLLERQVLTDPRPPMVACISEYVSRQVAADYGVPDQRRCVVFNGVEPRGVPDDQQVAMRERVRSGSGILPSAPLVLFVAHNPKLKGLRELLRAWPGVIGRWQAQDDSTSSVQPQLLIVGRGKQRGLRIPVAIESSVHFAEPVAEIETLYAAADLLAHPTWYDPCSRVVLEAVGAGIPAVTTRWNGAAEVIQAGVHGVVIEDPRDSDALAEAIVACLASEIRAACRRQAEAFRRQVSMDQHAAGLVQLYQRVLDE